MQADLTAAAKFYGLSYVPKMEYDVKMSQNYASFSEETLVIYYGEFPDNEDDYLRERFSAYTDAKLDHVGVVQYSLAHELYHAYQWQSDPRRVKRDDVDMSEKVELEQFMVDLGIVEDGTMSSAHDSDPLEIEADQHAAEAYKLVKVTL